MEDGAVLRVGHLLEAKVRGSAYAPPPRRAIAALAALDNKREDFGRAARDAVKAEGGDVVTDSAEVTRLLAGDELDRAGRAPTLVPVYAFDEILVCYGALVLRLHVAVTVCEMDAEKRISRSKAWVRCRQVLPAPQRQIKTQELSQFRDAAVKLAGAIVNAQVGIYEDALRTVVDEPDKQDFRVFLSKEVFTVLGLPGDDLQNFGRLFDEVTAEQRPLPELARRLIDKKDALTLWGLLSLLPKLGSPDKLLASEARLRELEKEDGPLALEVVPFQNSEQLRGLFLCLYDHDTNNPRVDAVGFAAPAPWEAKQEKPAAKRGAYRHAVAAVVASLSADLGSAV